MENFGTSQKIKKMRKDFMGTTEEIKEVKIPEAKVETVVEEKEVEIPEVKLPEKKEIPVKDPLFEKGIVVGITKEKGLGLTYFGDIEALELFGLAEYLKAKVEDILSNTVKNNVFSIKKGVAQIAKGLNLLLEK